MIESKKLDTMRRVVRYGFGMAPISKVMQDRFDGAVISVMEMLEGKRLPQDVKLEQVSELKGMFNRCIRKDQWDWFSVYERLGSPQHSTCWQFVHILVALRKAIESKEYKTVDDIATHAINSNMLVYLNAFRYKIARFENANGAGWIYMLSDKEQPNVLKIGMTERSVTQRVKEINAATGVLYPISPHTVFRVSDTRRAERLVFEALAPYRLRPDREFFHLEFKEAADKVEKTLGEAGLLQYL